MNEINLQEENARLQNELLKKQLQDRENKKKKKWIAILLAVLLGGAGAHKFYLGKPWQGWLYFFFSILQVAVMGLQVAWFTCILIIIDIVLYALNKKGDLK